MLKQKKYQFLFLILLGGLSAFGFAPCFLWPLTALGIVILMRMLNQPQTHKMSFLDGFFFGFGMGAVGMHWLTHALMVDEGRFAGLIPLVWLGFGLWFGLFWGFSALGASFLKRVGVVFWHFRAFLLFLNGCDHGCLQDFHGTRWVISGTIICL
jgi:apolipoprotein N-acyltransferase